MIGQSNQDEQTEKNRDNMRCRSTFADITSNPTQVNYPQVDVPTLEEDIVSEVRSEMDNVMTLVETRVRLQ